MSMPSMLSLAAPLFRKGMDLGNEKDAEPLQADLLRRIRTFNEEAGKAGYSAAVIEEARYALCAWLDEMVFYGSEISIGWLTYSLGMHEFQDQAAGSNFFERLQRLHQKDEFQPAMEVYADCIVMGFKGKYRIEDASVLKTLVQEVLDKKKEAGWRERPWFKARLREPGRRPKEKTGRSLVWIGVAFLILSVLFYFILAFLAQHLD